jgi:hypothetical protein
LGKKLHGTKSRELGVGEGGKTRANFIFLAEIHKEAKLFMQRMKHEFGRQSDTSSDCIIVFKSALN